MTKATDIPFAQDSSTFFICWISMLMVFLSVLTLAFALITHTSVENWHKNISGSMTVQIPTFTADGKERGDLVQTDIDAAMGILLSTDGVIDAQILSESQMDSLMAPWMGENASTAELPLPKLIDVKINTDRLPDLEQIKADFAEQVPLAVLDSHRLSLAELVTLAQNLTRLTGLILLLMLTSMAFSIIFVTKSGLKVHRQVIALIHMMGAGDFYITRQFANRSGGLAFSGGLIGFVLSLPVMAFIAYYLGNLTGGFIIQATLSTGQWLLLFTVPLIAALLAYLTAAYTVFSELKRSL